MPILSRRRLQAMLDDMANSMDTPKLSDLRARLENKRVAQALPAEIELAVLWALSMMGDIEVEPEWYGSRRPDAYTERLFEGNACAVEITAISDARLSQEDDMRRVATRLSEAANKIRKGHGRHLHFDFAEGREHTENGYIRRRYVDQNFIASDAINAQLRAWLALEGDRSPLRLTDGKTDVTVTWHARRRHAHRNFFSSMPAEAYSLEDNPLFDALQDKAQQLANPEFEGLKCVVVADVGSHWLRSSNDGMHSLGTVSAQQVIDHFLRGAKCGLDTVLVLSPYRENNSFLLPMNPVRWRSTITVRPGLRLPTAGIEKLVASLPPPRFEGYQARSLQQQAAYRPDARGWYVGTKITSGNSRMTIKLSARALLDLLAGRISLEQFQHFTGLSETPTQANIFRHRLAQGDILSDVKIEHGGIDEDDDWLVIELEQNPSAATLRLKEE